MPRLELESAQSIAMYLPWRRTARIVLPTIPSGRPRKTRGQRNSAARMRVPARRGASPRTIVSTSGSSGILRNIDQNVVTGDLNRKRGNSNFGIVGVGARAVID